ncbi:MAG: response regulator [Bacteroidetes bacterium]|nr:response regulator [Bacteroidota bacterium]
MTPPLADIRQILVIDDEAVPRRLLSSVLRDAGFEVSVAQSGLEVEKLFHQKEYQLVITDLRMPDMDGMAVLNWVQQNRAMALVMLVTGVTETETAVEAMKHGAIDYITKPFNPDAVLLGVQRAAEIYRLRCENQEYKEGLEALVEKRTEQLNRFADALSRKNRTIVDTNRKLKEANDKLQQFLNQAMITDKVTTIGLLASMLIHGIANPLGVISGITEVMEKRFVGDPVTSREIVMMQNYVHQVLTLVDQIRSYAKTDIFQFEKFDVSAAIQNTSALFKLLTRTKQVTIDTETGPDLWISGNRSQIEQVLANLVQNAFDAIEFEGLIRIRAERHLANVIITVTDDGSGISAENKERLFKMFFTTKKNNRGTGLGLFICHEIITKHGGSVAIDSTPGHGTTVSIQLPAV